MKISVSLIAVMLMSLSSIHAQEKKTNGSSFGLRGGVNFQNINGKNNNGDKLNNEMVTGFHVGINAELPLSGTEFYIQPGLLYSTKGAKAKDVILGTSVTNTIRINYLEVPINFLYKPLMGDGHLLLGFGPYVAWGLNGKVMYNTQGAGRTENIKFQKDVKLTDLRNVTYFNPFDAGANFLVGYEWSNKFSIQLNAQLGLTDINPTYEGSSAGKATAKNTGFGLSAGYRF